MLQEHRRMTIAGRQVRITTTRKRSKTSWRFYNALVVRFLDNNDERTMTAAQFAKWSTKLEREFKSAGANENEPSDTDGDMGGDAAELAQERANDARADRLYRD